MSKRGERGQRADCWLAPYDTRGRACDGRMDRAHLIDQQVLRKAGHGALCPDPRTWRWACRLHHANFDHYRGVVVPRAALGDELEALCAELNLVGRLDSRYGVRV